MRNFLFLLGIYFFTACSSSSDSLAPDFRLEKLDVIEPNQSPYSGLEVGGLSGIYIHQDTAYFISDKVVEKPFVWRFLVKTNENQNLDFTLLDTLHLKTDSNHLAMDPEEFVSVSGSDEYFYTDEGNINKGINGQVFHVHEEQIDTLNLPDFFLHQLDRGPQHNGVFEFFTVQNQPKGYWFGTELPLKESAGTDLPLVFYNADLNFVEKVDYPVSKPLREVKDDGVAINGVVAMLSIDSNKLWTLERSYASGYDDGGNDILLFEFYKNTAGKWVKKEIVNINHYLMGNFPDNIEGMAIYPLKDKNILVLVSDNNFNQYGAQKNQLIQLSFQKP